MSLHAHTGQNDLTWKCSAARVEGQSKRFLCSPQHCQQTVLMSHCSSTVYVTPDVHALKQHQSQHAWTCSCSTAMSVSQSFSKILFNFNHYFSLIVRLIQRPCPPTHPCYCGSPLFINTDSLITTCSLIFDLICYRFSSSDRLVQFISDSPCKASIIPSTSETGSAVNTQHEDWEQTQRCDTALTSQSHSFWDFQILCNSSKLCAANSVNHICVTDLNILLKR